MRPGPRNLITDVAGLRVGNAEDHDIRTGVTVLLGSRAFTAAVQVMGGAPGTRETDLLAPDKLVQEVRILARPLHVGIRHFHDVLPKCLSHRPGPDPICLNYPGVAGRPQPQHAQRYPCDPDLAARLEVRCARSERKHT